MRRLRETEDTVSPREQFVLVAITLLLGILIFALHAPTRWLAAIYCTVPTFAGMIAYFRGKLAPSVLWASMSGAFVVHLALLWMVFGVVLRHTANIPLWICLPAIFGESFVLYQAIRFVDAKFRAPRE